MFWARDPTLIFLPGRPILAPGTSTLLRSGRARGWPPMVFACVGALPSRSRDACALLVSAAITPLLASRLSYWGAALPVKRALLRRG